MKKWNKSLVAGITVLGLYAGSLGADAIAQGRHGRGYEGTGDSLAGRGHGYGMGMSYGMGYGMEARVEQRLAEMHDKLNLNQSQENAWKAYASFVKSHFGQTPKINVDDIKKMTAPERMEKALDWMKERQTRMAEHLAALKTFYSQLTKEQQKTFDDETLRARRQFQGKRGEPRR